MRSYSFVAFLVTAAAALVTPSPSSSSVDDAVPSPSPTPLHLNPTLFVQLAANGDVKKDAGQKLFNKAFLKCPVVVYRRNGASFFGLCYRITTLSLSLRQSFFLFRGSENLTSSQLTSPHRTLSLHNEQNKMCPGGSFRVSPPNACSGHVGRV